MVSCFFEVESKSQAQWIKLGANLILIVVHKWISKWLFDLYFSVDYSHNAALVLLSRIAWIEMEKCEEIFMVKLEPLSLWSSKDTSHPFHRIFCAVWASLISKDFNKLGSSFLFRNKLLKMKIQYLKCSLWMQATCRL